MLLKYDCGCVGIPTGVCDNALLVHVCDDPDGDSTTFSIRNMEGKSTSPIDIDSERRYITKVASLVGDGYRFREIKRLLSQELEENDNLLDAVDYDPKVKRIDDLMLKLDALVRIIEDDKADESLIVRLEAARNMSIDNQEEIMGAWGEGPIDNDTAADWFSSLKNTGIYALIEEGLRSSNYDEIRAAAFLLERIGINYVYDIDLLDRDKDLAREALKRILKDEEWLGTWAVCDVCVEREIKSSIRKQIRALS